ncbi:DUF397 domain-containing protein [Streptomyces sp. NPDC001276]|uniref:DUF397 domain-containing protein n=1 Tax=Streptomyces sp. NPDC001276 TaxID=3364555 RepID=UPI00367B2896
MITLTHSGADESPVEGEQRTANLGGAVAVRDSNRRDLSPLRFTAEQWAAFRDGVREGEFG